MTRLLRQLEHWLFAYRPIVLCLFALASTLLLIQAAQLRPATSFEKMLPASHPFIKNMLAHRDDLAPLGNTLRIAVEATSGDIFNAQYLYALRELQDEVFYLPGVDRAGLKSLWSPSVRWIEVTEDGFVGGQVIPQGYDGSAASLQQLRTNLLKAGQVGRLVANDFRSSIIEVPLLESYPDPEVPGRVLKLEYPELSRLLEERVRERYTGNHAPVRVHIVGFAKKVGDLIDGLLMVGLFFIWVLLLTAVSLYAFIRCMRSTLAVLGTSLVAVGWQMGLMHSLGFGLDPYSMLVPFLIFAIGISHGVQIINGIARASGDVGVVAAARTTFRQLAMPGMIAILADAVGFITLLVIDIGVIQEMAVSASLGVAVILLTHLLVLPVLVSYLGIGTGAMRRQQRQAAEGSRFWSALANLASHRVAPWSLALALTALAAGLWYGQRLEVGDLDQGAPELRADSRYNLDNRFIIEHYATRSDVLVVMVRTGTEQCSSHATLTAMDDLMWTLDQQPGVQGTLSLVSVAKQMIQGMNEGSLKWRTLSRNQDVLNNATSHTPGLFNADCSLAPVLVFLDDHKARTLQAVVAAVKAFAAQHDRVGLEFVLAAGNAGVEAATNEVVAASELTILLWIYGAVALMCLAIFRSLAGTLCVLLPLMLTSVLGNALMAYMGIGIKVATLPVIALGVGIGVDYGIYIYSRLAVLLDEGLGLQEAYYQTLRSTGRAVLFTGLCLGLGVASWMFSPIKFQADMGLMLTFMLLWNMVGALWLLPALACYLLRPWPWQAQAPAGRFRARASAQEPR